MLRQLRDKPAITKDGIAVALYGNISSYKEIENLDECGGEGVGLLRTELFFMTLKTSLLRKNSLNSICRQPLQPEGNL